MRILENDSLQVSVSDVGAELCSVIDKADGTERIWTADPAYWNRHAPILFPFVGKVYQGTYRTGNRSYAMKTQHGFARDCTFCCESADPASVVHTLLASEKTKEIYPFAFKLTVTHQLDAENPRALHVFWTVENRGNEQMPYSIGAHPGFQMPEAMPKEESLLFLPGRKEYSCYHVNADGYAIESERDTVLPENGYVPVDASLKDTWIFDEGQIRQASICLADGAPFVTLYCPDFPLFAIWSKSGAPFICLEPWYGRTDAEGFSGTILEKNGIQTLEPSEKRTFHYSMVFHSVR